MSVSLIYPEMVLCRRTAISDHTRRLFDSKRCTHHFFVETNPWRIVCCDVDTWRRQLERENVCKIVPAADFLMSDDDRLYRYHSSSPKITCDSRKSHMCQWCTAKAAPINQRLDVTRVSEENEMFTIRFCYYSMQLQ